MKTRIAVLALAVVSSLTLAQPDGSPANNGKPPHMTHPHLEQMEDKLGLTDEQMKQMREIRDSGGSMADMRAVLTPEQQVKAAQLRKEHKADLDDRKAKMQEYLGLSEEQMTKMTQIRKTGGSREDMRAVLTPEQLAKFDAMHRQHGGMGQSPEEEPVE